jgi:NAD(P)-dependent dehydrogenase (short-subunit alcohol dehydrogenase family)
MKTQSYLDDLFGLSGRVAVVIGGTGELCGAIAEGLAAAGAEVVLVGRNAGKATARLGRIEAGGGRGWFQAAEATSKRDLAALLDAVIGRSGRVDVVVNGAGVNSATPFLEIPEEEFERIVRVNLGSVFLSCQVFGRHMVESGQGGSIINIGSMSGLVPAVARVHLLGDQGRRPQHLEEPRARMGAAPRPGEHTGPGVLPRRAEPKGPDARARRQHHGPHARWAASAMPGSLSRRRSSWRGTARPPSSPVRSSPSTAASMR